MGFVLIALGAFIIIGIILTVYNCGDLVDTMFGGLLGGLIGVIPSFIIGGMISIMILGTSPMECKYTQELMAMKDNTSISGSFFLGTGRADSEMCYIYLVETDKGMHTKTLKQNGSYEVYIKCTDGTPYLEYWDAEEDFWRLPDESPYYVFYLPEGSVVNTYEIDLE